MKKKSLTLAIAVILTASVSFQSCIGSFSLTNKVLTWNRQVSNKFVNELVFFAFWILPVYEVTAAADLLVINSIEFWSGNKPLEAHNQIIDSEHGRYLIAVDDNGYTVTSPFGDISRFDFNPSSRTWSFSINESEKTEFLKFKNDNHVEVLGPRGDFIDVEISEQGINQYKWQMVMQPLMACNIPLK